MSFELPPLPYAPDALEPFLSELTMKTHHGKHHKGYVDKLNKLVEGTRYANMDLKQVMMETRESDKKIYNNAAQAWNHTFFWNCMAPGGKKISNELSGVLIRAFGSVDNFKKEFSESGQNQFGSGWTWLVQNAQGDIRVRSTANAHNPLSENEIPLLVCDVWEHAYYLDYKNERAKFLDQFWDVVNWEFVEAELNHSNKTQAELVANLN